MAPYSFVRKDIMKKLISIIAICIVMVLVVKISMNQYSRIEVDPKVSSAGYESLSSLDRDVRCMADNIYMEAGVESVEGKLAVAIVTLNRVNSSKFKDSICGVVYSKSQFSWTLNTPQNQNNYKHKNWKLYQESIEIAKRVIIEKYTIPSLNKSVMWYHADYIGTPIWAKRMKHVTKIGRHHFYSE